VRVDQNEKELFRRGVLLKARLNQKQLPLDLVKGLKGQRRVKRDEIPDITPRAEHDGFAVPQNAIL
jgi:hypothetical protein